MSRKIISTKKKILKTDNGYVMHVLRKIEEEEFLPISSEVLIEKKNKNTAETEDLLDQIKKAK